jgi:hypothetical protein
MLSEVTSQWRQLEGEFDQKQAALTDAKQRVMRASMPDLSFFFYLVLMISQQHVCMMRTNESATRWPRGWPTSGASSRLPCRCQSNTCRKSSPRSARAKSNKHVLSLISFSLRHGWLTLRCRAFRFWIGCKSCTASWRRRNGPWMTRI